MDERAIEGYFASRLEPDTRRATLWLTLCRYAFQRYVPPGGAVLELGAARGDFINHIRAARRIAVDVWADMPEHCESGVEAYVRSAVDLGPIDTDSIDLVFASNFLEHLNIDQARSAVLEAQRVLRTGGCLILLQPNYRIAYRRYFDDFTHVTVWSDVGLADFLRAEGFSIESIRPRFLPLTVKARLPIHPLLIRAYLASPVKPLAGQMLVVARRV